MHYLLIQKIVLHQLKTLTIGILKLGFIFKKLWLNLQNEVQNQIRI